MDALNEFLPAGFTFTKTLVFGVVLCLGLKGGELIAGALSNAVSAAQRKR